MSSLLLRSDCSLFTINFYVLLIFFFTLCPFSGGVGFSGTSPPFLPVESLVRVKSRGSEVSIQFVEPALPRAAFRSFAVDFDVEANLGQRIVVGVGR